MHDASFAEEEEEPAHRCFLIGSRFHQKAGKSYVEDIPQQKGVGEVACDSQDQYDTSSCIVRENKLIHPVHDVVEEAAAALEVIHGGRGDFLTGIGCGEIVSQVADQSRANVGALPGVHSFDFIISMLRLSQGDFLGTRHSDKLGDFTGNDPEECQQECKHNDSQIIGTKKYVGVAAEMQLPF